jgi:hypothetical protein
VDAQADAAPDHELTLVDDTPCRACTLSLSHPLQADRNLARREVPASVAMIFLAGAGGRLQFLGFRVHTRLKPAANRVQRGLPKLQLLLKQLPPPLALRILRIPDLELALAVVIVLQLATIPSRSCFAG